MSRQKRTHGYRTYVSWSDDSGSADLGHGADDIQMDKNFDLTSKLTFDFCDVMMT